MTEAACKTSFRNSLYNLRPAKSPERRGVAILIRYGAFLRNFRCTTVLSTNVQSVRLLKMD